MATPERDMQPSDLQKSISVNWELMERLFGAEAVERLQARLTAETGEGADRAAEATQKPAEAGA